MVVRIRLARWGSQRNPFYGIVAANARAARDGKHLERLGTYNPIPNNGVKHIQLNTDRIKYWLSVGAQPSDRVAWLLSKAGLMPPLPIQAHREGKVVNSEFGKDPINRRAKPIIVPAANATERIRMLAAVMGIE